MKLTLKSIVVKDSFCCLKLKLFLEFVIMPGDVLFTIIFSHDLPSQGKLCSVCQNAWGSIRETFYDNIVSA